MQLTGLEGATLAQVVEAMQRAFDGGAAFVELDALDPDRARGRHAGERVELDGVAFVHRPWRVWVELADRLGCRLATPLPQGGARVRIRLERLAPRSRDRDPGRYGEAGAFARVHQLEDPSFLLDWRDAVARAALPTRPRVLDLGCGRGELLADLARRLPDAALVGVDRDASALAVARRALPGANLLEADLNTLDAATLGAFDLVFATGVLQSPSVDDRALLRVIVGQLAAPAGAIVLGVPNARVQDGELTHGGRVVNLREPELGLVVKDVAFYRRYLQQHRARVYVTGRHLLLVTAVGARAGGRGTG